MVVYVAFTLVNFLLVSIFIIMIIAQNQTQFNSVLPFWLYLIIPITLWETENDFYFITKGCKARSEDGW